MPSMLHMTAALLAAPNFPTDFYSGVQMDLILAQGGYTSGKSVCCPKGTSACKVQTESVGNDLYEQGSMDRTLTMGGATGIQMKWYGKAVDKMMLLAPGSQVNSSHKWACMAYCPLRGASFFSEVAIAAGGEKVSDLGMANKSQPGLPGGATKLVHGFGWTERLLKLIPMAKYEMWVDESGAEPIPFVKHEIIEPFGKPQAQGNTSYTGFKALNVSAQFDIDMDTVKSCKRVEMGKCPNDPQPPHPPMMGQHEAVGLRPKTLLERAFELASRAPDAGDKASPQAATLPTLPKDFSSVEDLSFLISEGGKVDPKSGDTCCDSTQPGQCQVQESNNRVMRYMDVTNQRVRVDNVASGTGSVVLAATQQELTVNISASGALTCVHICPFGENVTAFHIPQDAKDQGSTTYKNETVEVYAWVERVLKVIKMSDVQLWVHPGSPATPALSFETLTPLGNAPIGTQNISYVQYTPGTPAASKFDVNGLETCPKYTPEQCANGPGLQAQRLRARQYLTWAMYEGL